jgi:hypothetical protein
MKSLIDTDIKNNVGHIRPYLGIALIGSIALGLGLIIYNATADLAQALQTNTDMPDSNTEHVLSIETKGAIQYGDSIAYKSSFEEAVGDGASAFITTVCFQDDEMVYQVSAEEDASVYLYDQREGRLEWDGKNASCTATLMYRTVSSDTVHVSLIDSLTFEVEERGY